jgi:hypothetical protein
MSWKGCGDREQEKNLRKREGKEKNRGDSEGGIECERKTKGKKKSSAWLLFTGPPVDREVVQTESANFLHRFRATEP